VGVKAASRPVQVIKANLFRVLGNPRRVKILELLRDGERSVGSLQVLLHLGESSTSRHLVALRRMGLVEARRVETTTYYRVDNPRVFDLLAAGRDIVTGQLTD
jgi:DNA-binding transcriptional ArsR family regulator